MKELHQQLTDNRVLKKNNLLFICFLFGLSFYSASQIELLIPNIVFETHDNKTKVLVMGDTLESGLKIKFKKNESIESILLYKKGKRNGFSYFFKKGNLTSISKFKNDSLVVLDSTDENIFLTSVHLDGLNTIDSTKYSIRLKISNEKIVISINSEGEIKKFSFFYLEGKLFAINLLNINDNTFTSQFFNEKNKDLIFVSD